MLYSGTDPESYTTEYTLVFEGRGGEVAAHEKEYSEEGPNWPWPSEV